MTPNANPICDCLDSPNEIKSIQAVRLDVTVHEDTDASVKAVVDGGKKLHGLVNKSGVYVGSPLIDVDLNEVKWLMDVNVSGHFSQLHGQAHYASWSSIEFSMAERIGPSMSIKANPSLTSSSMLSSATMR